MKLPNFTRPLHGVREHSEKISFFFFFETMRNLFLSEFSGCCHLKILLPRQREKRLLISIQSYFGATLALPLIPWDGVRVSILTLISFTEKEKGQGTIPYFCAIIDHFRQDSDSFESLHSTFSCSFTVCNFSETWLTICDWTDRYPALERTRNTKVFLAP